MKVVITDADFDIEIERGIFREAGFTLELAQCRTPQDVIQAGRGATAFLVQYAPVTGEVFEALPELRVVSRYGVGVDTVDLEAAKEHGVWVTNVPDYGTEEVAAHAFAMALSLVRHLPFHDRNVRAGTWSYQASGPVRRARVLTLGMVGLGRIGRAVAERAKPWFEEVIGYDPYLEAWPPGIERMALEEVFSQAHVISLHLPLTGNTRKLVNRDLLSSVQRGSYLVNTARGGLIDTEALLWALDEGLLAGAALDVLPLEPPHKDDPILRHPRVLLSPHAAFYSQEAEQELRGKAASNIVKWASEGRPTYVVVEGKLPG